MLTLGSNIQLMKTPSALLFFAFLVLLSCGKTGENTAQDYEDQEGEDPNRALYDRVMDLHDEVMPKMEDIYRIKAQLREKIANSPNMVQERKQKIESLILQLDASSKSMMDWMHDFEPLPDTADQEEAREYLEDQMEKIKQVKEGISVALEEAKKEVDGGE